MFRPGVRYVYWEEGPFFYGFFEDYPDYMTQGETLEDLEDHLRDLYTDLTAAISLASAG